MKVKYLDIAEKEAIKLKAQPFFQLAVDMLRDTPLEKLLKQKDVIPLKGKHMTGAYEIRPGGYRGIFVRIRDHEALIFGFFKKEGKRLKRTELKTIEQRLKRINEKP